ncbi:unnamed protein product [Prorocentrum cordatum]|uniref:Hcy-binding domain-containing protein n=1 Tax=Prorocentrum cordatum TaxID=2364126 RepID=A0ABN9WT21_9DINO|nr:unnamed protein product [Polarella glacialis]
MPGYVTFSCRSNTELCSGEKEIHALHLVTTPHSGGGVSAGCTAPQHVESLIGEAKAGIDDARQARSDSAESDAAFEVNIVVYPNLGEIYDGETKTWKKDPALGPTSFTDLAQKWREAGATWIGGLDGSRHWERDSIPLRLVQPNIEQCWLLPNGAPRYEGPA